MQLSSSWVYTSRYPLSYFDFYCRGVKLESVTLQFLAWLQYLVADLMEFGFLQLSLWSVRLVGHKMTLFVFSVKWKILEKKEDFKKKNHKHTRYVNVCLLVSCCSVYVNSYPHRDAAFPQGKGNCLCFQRSIPFYPTSSFASCLCSWAFHVLCKS